MTLLRLIFRLCAALLLLSLLAVSCLVALRPNAPAPLLSLTRFAPNTTVGSSLWLRDVDRRSDIRLIESARLLYALWLPSGEQVVYFYDDVPGSAVFVYDVATGHIQPGPVIARLLPLSWSPDGRWLLLYNFTTNQISAMPRQGATFGEPVYVAAGSSDVLWSPDGSRIYYLDSAATPSAIETGCLDGVGFCIPQLVPVDQPIEQLAGWMPDGERLMVVAGRRDTGQPDLFSLDLDDGHLRRIAEYLLPGASPSWSPDGAVLALSLALPVNDAPSSGSEPIPGVYLIEGGGPPRLLWTGIAGELGWSPDGARLAFELISRVGNDRSVWVYDRRDATLTRTTAAGAHEAAPQWILFPGRPFEPALPLAAVGLLVLALWLTRIRRAGPDGASEAVGDVA